jgi:hypothetical protein
MSDEFTRSGDGDAPVQGARIRLLGGDARRPRITRRFDRADGFTRAGVVPTEFVPARITDPESDWFIQY